MKKILYSVLTLTLGLVLSSSGCTHDTIDTALFDEGVTIGGVTWATRNVGEPGKFTATSEDVGMYYQWNHKIGWSFAGSLISTPSAIWDDTNSAVATWDAANDPCPDGWQVPSQDQCDALTTADGSIWDGVKKGWVFGSGVNSIFVPAAGIIMTDSPSFVGSNGYYWTKDQQNISDAYGFKFADTWAHAMGGSLKKYGLTIRCVKGAK